MSFILDRMNIRQGPYRIDEPKKRTTLFSKKLFLVVVIAIVGLVGLAGFRNNDNEVTKVASVAVESENEVDNDAKEQARLELQKRIEASPLSRLELPTTGQSAIGTLELGTILTSTDDQQVPIASITKLITSLAILDKEPLQLGEQGRELLLTAQDEKYYWDYVALQGTITPVTAGFSMTTYEALQAMLLASSNNMSDTIVDNYFASKQDYLDYANEYLKRQGLDNTQVADTTGFSADSKSTPSDLIKLAQLALNNPVIKQIVAQPEATISVAGEIPNYNPIINDPNVIGLKPGATDEAGYTLLFAADLPNSNGGIETFIGVALGFQDRAEYVQTAKNMVEAARQAL